ncbi:aldehyde dehydrogenase family protein [Alkalicoccus saliphilus]|uniref:Aldehyde dehydrogenase n=1 Tax=Alkalicoccus saliphilus TaxID=200989 RepID=A0A2T4U4P6_9BACI|nr:aldehyde dehydrogenase family protein [Alkalicoccus saliphilus]PTL38377.1 aldehyde dehydrogenase [Alkalicoccus saliphilus]
MSKTESTSQGIDKLVYRAKEAQKMADSYTQEEVRNIAASIGWFAVKKAEDWAHYNYEELKIGDIESKINRTQARARGIMRDIKHAKTVGVIEDNHEKQLIKIGKPVGVVASLVPMTVPEGVVFIGMMNAIMGRNAMICAPHPRAKETTLKVVNEIRELFKRLNVPEDLLLCIEEPSLSKTDELMQACDLIVATGGAGMVKAAYSSGTPAYGVGAGNVVVVIDETAEVEEAAHKIMEAQMNDLASGCSTENATIIQEEVYDKTLEAMASSGGYVCSLEEKEKLQAVLWKDGNLNPEVIIKPASFIAEKAGFKLPEDKTWLIVEEEGIGPQYPFSGEKLSVVVAVYKYEKFDEAIDKVNNIQAYSGAGHSCGIHSALEDRILDFALKTKTSRVAVNMPVGKSNAGNWNNGMPFTINLGCGTWGNNITSENITYKHYINTTWVAKEIKNYKVPTDEELFGEVMKNENI